MVNNVDRSFRALGHPVRREIVERLARGPATVGDATAGLNVSKPAVSKHVKVLEGAGLLTREVEGRTHRLRLSEQPLVQAGGWIERQRALWESKFDTIEDYLEEERR
ncbi:MAG TPA: metalloregulator ArsR/SmtB family transcription factor [Thermoleophilaceae bacterium]|jgi:DNA-binding transcriptional ArsR family regulator|nr:metalloregulator ArsR/SmtB family transcription factor [Thermoleophilaceae bacterium]